MESVFFVSYVDLISFFYTLHLQKSNRKNWLIHKFEYFFQQLYNFSCYFCWLTVAYDELNQSAHLDAKCRAWVVNQQPLISAAHRQTEARATRRFMTDVPVFFSLGCVCMLWSCFCCVLRWAWACMFVCITCQREHIYSAATGSIVKIEHLFTPSGCATRSWCSLDARSSILLGHRRAGTLIRRHTRRLADGSIRSDTCVNDGRTLIGKCWKLETHSGALQC